MPPRRKLVSPGSIDKFEFAALAEEIEQNYKRRSVLTAVAAAVGAVIVAKSSEEYAIAQKTFRGYYIEQKAEEAQRRCPTASRTVAAAAAAAAARVAVPCPPRSCRAPARAFAPPRPSRR